MQEDIWKNKNLAEFHDQGKGAFIFGRFYSLYRHRQTRKRVKWCKTEEVIVIGSTVKWNLRKTCLLKLNSS